MNLKSLPDEDKAAVLQCMSPIAESQMVEDWEFHTRLGLNRQTLKAIVSRWPNIDDSVPDSEGFLAINNCMNEICHGVQIPPEQWDKWFTLTRAQILGSYLRWSGRQENYFSGLR